MIAGARRRPAAREAPSGPPRSLANIRDLSFSVDGVPVPKARPRFSTRGGIPRTYTDARTVAFEDHVALVAKTQARAQRWRLAEGRPLSVSLSFYLPKPKLGSRARPCCRPDLDNLAKSVLDGIGKSGAVWKDDGQIVGLFLRKQYAAPEEVGCLVIVCDIAD